MLEEYRGSEQARFSKIAILVCVLQKTPLLLKEVWRGKTMTGWLLPWRNRELSCQVGRAQPSVHDLLLFALFRVFRG
jgi:hypothetical protein